MLKPKTIIFGLKISSEENRKCSIIIYYFVHFYLPWPTRKSPFYSIHISQSFCLANNICSHKYLSRKLNISLYLHKMWLCPRKKGNKRNQRREIILSFLLNSFTGLLAKDHESRLFQDFRDRKQFWLHGIYIRW